MRSRPPLLRALAVLGLVAACASDEPSVPEALTERSIAPIAGVPVATVEVVRAIPHRVDAFTQGLAFDGSVLYESAGRVGRSSLALVDPTDGSVERAVAVDPEVFAEGLALVGDRLVQLTWQDEVAFVWDAASFEQVGEHRYDGEGWGLCFDGERLVMSDGSPELTFRDPDTFEEVGSVDVRLGDEPVDDLNELECVDGRVYANVWHTDVIVEIDPADGSVTTVVDAAALRSQLDPAPTDGQAVLNGIAHDGESGTFWLTGKLWPQLFEVRITRPS